MNKISTKLRQKQTAIPKQILQSRFLEMSVADIEEELQDEIEKNPVLVEKDLEDFRDKNTFKVKSFEEFKDLINTTSGFIRCGWDGTAETENAIKNEKLIVQKQVSAKPSKSRNKI